MLNKKAPRKCLSSSIYYYARCMCQSRYQRVGLHIFKPIYTHAHSLYFRTMRMDDAVLPIRDKTMPTKKA